MSRHFYRAPWTADRVEFIAEWWPHFGTYYVADSLGLTRRQVKAKADKLGLHMLPKTDRLCAECKRGHQHSRRCGLMCSDCFSVRRKELRRAHISNDPLSERLREIVRTLTYRNGKRGVPCDITTDYLKGLWDKQRGTCVYTGQPMTINDRVGIGRSMSGLSIDRIDTGKPYSRDNITLCTLWANIARNCCEPEEFVSWCVDVIVHLDSQILSPQFLEQYHRQAQRGFARDTATAP